MKVRGTFIAHFFAPSVCFCVFQRLTEITFREVSVIFSIIFAAFHRLQICFDKIVKSVWERRVQILSYHIMHILCEYKSNHNTYIDNSRTILRNIESLTRETPFLIQVLTIVLN